MKWWFVDLRGNLGSLASIPVTPTAATFVNGVWTGTVTVGQNATGVTLQADDGAGHVATSNAFDVITRRLNLNLPTSASESAGTIDGTVTIDIASAVDTVVSLTSSLPSRLSVPSTVIIPAGQTSAPVPITLIDNDLLDGADSVTISASAAAASGTTKSVQVLDDELGELTFTLPSSAAENAGTIVGTITSNLAPTKNTVIQLNSGNSSLVTAPITVTMPAGQTSVSFNLSVVNNNRAELNPNVTISASGERWIAADGSIDILDEDSVLSLTLPTSLWEGQSISGVARVTMGGIRSSDTVIDLLSSDLTLLGGPSTVTILAGQTSATFTVTAPTDGMADGRQGAQLSVSAPGLTGASATTTIHDRDLDHFTTAAIASPRTAGIPFAWSASAMNIDNELIAIFNDTVTFTATGAAGQLPFTPGSATFAAGTWSGNIKIDAVDSDVLLSISNGAGISAASNSFATVAGALTHFVWNHNPGNQLPGVPFNMTITGKDANGYTADYNGSADLSGAIGIQFVSKSMFGDAAADRLASAGTNTYGYSFTPDTDLTVTHFRSYFGTKVSLWSNTGTLLASSAVTSIQGTWVETPLNTPVNLVAGVTYRIAAYTGGQPYRFRIDMPSTTPIGTINQSLHAPGDAFPNTTIPLKWAFVDIKSSVGTAIEVPVTPGTVNFVNGVWSGAVTVPFAAAGMHLTIRDQLGHSASTADFNVAVPASAAPLLDASADTGASAGDGITHYNNASAASKLVFSVTGAVPGATVRLYANGVLVGSTVASGADVVVESDGSTTIPDGAISFTTRQTLNGVESPGSPATVITIDTTAPAVSNSAFEFETRQALTISSTEPLPGLVPGALTLVNLSTGATIPSGSVAIGYASGKYSLTFSAFESGRLPDGSYQLTIPTAAIADAAGNVAATDLLFNFYVLGGDANRDGKVDLTDLYIVSSNFAHAGVFSQGDFNYDGTVDSWDLMILSNNWQKMLPPPPAAQQTTITKPASRRSPSRVINVVP